MYREIAGELNSLRKYLIDDREQARMSEAILANRSIITSSSSVLNHSDLTMNHIFVNGSPIIDFGNLSASDPYHDLAIIHLEWPDDVTSIIKEYQREVDLVF